MLKVIGENYIDLQWFASAEDEGRTEEPSEYKLKKAREEGRVAKSQEINGAFVLILPIVCLIILAPWILKKCIGVVTFFLSRSSELGINDGILWIAFLNYFLPCFLPIAIVAMIAGVTGNIIQNKGFLFSTKPIEPKFSKVLPKFGEYFKKTLFSFEGLFNIAKSIIKVLIIVVIAYTIIKGDLPNLLTLLNVDLYKGISHVAWMVAKLLIFSSIVFLVIAIPDYLVQKKQFMESMKMSKQEVKEEYKMMEGDPLVKSRLRQRMQEMLRQNVSANVAKADVVITNPTHYAVSVLYDKTTMPGPMVNAKGVDSMAQRIKEIARENDVPIVENRPLARALYAEVEIGDIIPSEYYQALAVILARVYTMKSTKVKT